MATVDTIQVPFLNCRRSVRLPSGQIRANERLGRRSVVFCSSRCNKEYIAKKAQEDRENV
jgi:hypothetical protein